MYNLFKNISACPWWRHQMETFSVLLAICAGNSPVPGEFPTQRPVTRSFDVFFDRRPNKRLSKQSWGWCFETLSRSLWRHRNVTMFCSSKIDVLIMAIWLFFRIFQKHFPSLLNRRNLCDNQVYINYQWNIKYYSCISNYSDTLRDHVSKIVHKKTVLANIVSLFPAKVSDWRSIC